MRPASCCSERSSNNDGFASSNVFVRAGRYSMMGERVGVVKGKGCGVERWRDT